MNSNTENMKLYETHLQVISLSNEKQITMSHTSLLLHNEPKRIFVIMK